MITSASLYVWGAVYTYMVEKKTKRKVRKVLDFYASLWQVQDKQVGYR